MANSAYLPRADLLGCLALAAELEQAVICQYLFAAYSLRSHPADGNLDPVVWESIREWKAHILAVARNEMEHLGLVWNLLSSLGGTPQAHLPDFPHPARGGPPTAQFELLPFGEETLERFIQLERLHAQPGQGFESIWDLYQKIRAGLLAFAASGQPLFIGGSEGQVTSGHIDLTPGWHDIHLVPVHDLNSAVGVIDRILEAGDAPQSHAASSTHADRFARILAEYRALRARDPGLEPALPVVANPILSPTTGGVAAGTLLEHPLSCQAAALFNRAYQVTLDLLGRLYRVEPVPLAERLTVGRLALFPLMTMVLRPLAEMLVTMPARIDPMGGNAGPTFQLVRGCGPALQPRSARIAAHEQLEQLVADAQAIHTALQQEPARWAGALRPRWSFLCENLQSIAIRHASATGVRGEVAQLQFDQLRESL